MKKKKITDKITNNGMPVFGYRDGDPLVLYKRTEITTGKTRIFVTKVADKAGRWEDNGNYTREVLMESDDANLILKAKALAEGV